MRTNRDRLIERYINGRMSSSEQREFLDMAESDPNIRRILKAEQVISNAITRDLGALPAIAAEPSAQLLSRLAASNPVAQQASQLAAESVASTAGGTGGGSSIFFGSKIVQAFAAVAGTVGVVVTTLVVAPMLDSSKEDSSPVPSSGTAPVQMNAPAPEALDRPQVDPVPQQKEKAEMTVTSAPEAAKPADASLAPNSTEPAERETKASAPNTLQPKQTNGAETTTSSTKHTPPAQDQEEPPVILSDSVHLKLNVD